MAMPNDKVEMLLNEIQQIKAFYDPKDINYKNNAYLLKEWDRLAAKLNITVKASRQKWKMMLAMLRCEMRKHPKPRLRAGASDRTVSTWEWFESMQFVVPYQKPRASSANLSKALKVQNDQDETLDFENDLDDDLEELANDFNDLAMEPEVEAIVEPSTKKINIPPKEVPCRCQKKPTLLRLMHLDEVYDELYLETLVNDIATMDRVAKLNFRKQLMELVLRFSRGRHGLLED